MADQLSSKYHQCTFAAFSMIWALIHLFNLTFLHCIDTHFIHAHTSSSPIWHQLQHLRTSISLSLLKEGSQLPALIECTTSAEAINSVVQVWVAVKQELQWMQRKKQNEIKRESSSGRADDETAVDEISAAVSLTAELSSLSDWLNLVAVWRSSKKHVCVPKGKR